MGKFGLSREDVLDLMRTHIHTENLFKHCLATESIMRKVAERVGADSDDWGLIGLVHDLDYETTKDTPEKHSLGTAEILRERGVPEEFLQAIVSHNEAVPGSRRESVLEHLLAASENITGLIVAAALVQPEKKLANVRPKSIRKRMKEKAFARSVDRGAIMECESAGIPLNEFIELSLRAMQDIHLELGL